MSILIKGMEMPKNGDYVFSFASDENGENTICQIERINKDGGGTIIEHSGVVEVSTPHGDLVDRDDMKFSIEHFHGRFRFVNEPKVVIGSEEENDNQQ